MADGNGRYNLSPSKETYKSLQSDVSPISAVKELIDNAIDNWRRVEQKNPDLHINIQYSHDERTFRIQDDSGGVRDEEMAKVFALGASSKEKITQSIGSYGMGAKKAIIRLGKKATIKSRTFGSDLGYGFTIDEGWLNADNTWTVDREEYDLPAGTTLIEIEETKIEIGEEHFEEEEVEESTRYKSQKDFIEALVEDFSETYEDFLLGQAGREDGNVVIEINGIEVEPAEQPEWSFTPYDGYHPRHFKNYEISGFSNRDSPVNVSIVAGLFPTGESAQSGTDIFIQNRKIISQSTSKDGGWGDHLPKWGPQKRRTKFQVRISAEESPETLPWDTQKSNIDIDDQVTKKIFNFLRRVGENYAGVRYEDFPSAFTEEYPHDSEYAPYDSPEELDYSSRELVTNKPDREMAEAGEVQDLIQKHVEYGVFAPHLVAENHRPAYVAEFNRIWGKEGTGEYWEIPDEATEFTEPLLHALLEEVLAVVETDVNHSQKVLFSDESPWWSSYYKQKLKEKVDVDSLTKTRECPNLKPNIEERVKQDDLPEKIIDKTLAVNIQEAENSWITVKEDSEESKEISEKEEGGEEADDSKKESKSGKEDKEGNESDKKDKKESGEKTTDKSKSKSSSGMKKKEESHKSILIRVSEEEYEEICQKVGAPEDISGNELGERIVAEGIEIIGMISDSEDS